MDAYEAEVERLTQIYYDNPDESDDPLYMYWGSYKSFLFQDVGEDDAYDGYPCGCLTQVKGGDYCAQTKELTDEIRADERIPDSGFNLTPEVLPVFAEWRRKLDKINGITRRE